MKNWIILLLLALIIVPKAQTFTRSCSNGVSKPLNVNINDCQSSPCKIKKNQVFIVKINFNTTQATKTLQPRVTFKKFGIDLNYETPSSLKDACKHIVNTACPLEANQQVHYELKVLIEDFYPSIYLELFVTFIGDNNKPMACFAVDILIY